MLTKVIHMVAARFDQLCSLTTLLQLQCSLPTCAHYWKKISRLYCCDMKNRQKHAHFKAPTTVDWDLDTKMQILPRSSQLRLASSISKASFRLSTYNLSHLPQGTQIHRIHIHSTTTAFSNKFGHNKVKHLVPDNTCLSMAAELTSQVEILCLRS